MIAGQFPPNGSQLLPEIQSRVNFLVNKVQNIIFLFLILYE